MLSPHIRFLALLLVSACVVACRGMDEPRAVIAGMMLLPILFYPANYHLHFIFSFHCSRPMNSALRVDRGLQLQEVGSES